MASELATRQNGPSSAGIVEQVIAKGDLAKLSPDERVAYYTHTCQSLGLNPLTKPFEYISLQGKLTLYATRTCTDQLRSLQDVSVEIVSREQVGDVYIVTARATKGRRSLGVRCDESTGVVSIAGLKGDALANAYMKAETKAKRRVTLSLCGLGWLDESEVDSIAGAQRVVVEDSGEIAKPRAQPGPAKPVHAEMEFTEAVLEAETVDDVPHPADTYADEMERAEADYHQERQETANRPNGAPATPRQIQTIQRMARAAGKTVPTEGITRQKASELISSLIAEMPEPRT